MWSIPTTLLSVTVADTLRLYEMFLDPLEQSKPWDTNGIDGANRFLKNFGGILAKSIPLSVSL